MMRFFVFGWGAAYSRVRTWTGAWTGDGQPINEASVARLLSKNGILAISTSPVRLQLFFMPSDYCVVLL